MPQELSGNIEVIEGNLREVNPQYVHILLLLPFQNIKKLELQ